MMITFRPIGIIHTPFKEAQGTPIQPAASNNIEGSIKIFDEFIEGLKDLDGFSHIILIYHLHLSHETPLLVKPFMDDKLHGVFSTRSPGRPNPIGLSTVELLQLKGDLLNIRGVDMIDGTPLLDIKPYVPQIDDRTAARIGWLENNLHKLHTTKDDGRFVKKEK